MLIVRALILPGCTDEQGTADIPPPVKSTKEIAVIAYQHGDTSDVDKYAIGDLTHLIYSFLYLNGNEISIATEQQRADIVRLVALKKVYPGLKVLVALGGWGGCETCSDAFSTEKGREAFAASVKVLLSDYDLDGLDLDWEYPAVEGYPGHRFRPADRPNFTALIRVLRDILGNHYELSFAAGAGPKYLHDAVDWSEIMPLVDRVNLMTYDFVNDNSTSTGHHTPLYSTAAQAASTDHAVRHLLDLGVERQKILIGAAFYARIWDKVDAGDGDPLYREARFKETVGFKKFAKYFGYHFVAYWDAEAQAPYTYNGTDKIFGTFDDRRSVRLKTRYAIDRGLGGIMFWQLGDDSYRGGLLAAISEVKRMAQPKVSGSKR